jgi:F-type H+-transporting ATPase subunit b
MQQAESDYRRSLDEARAEAARIREEARAQGQEIIDEARREAQAESDRVIAQGREQLGAERDGIVREIRASIGSLAVDLAGRMVGEPIGDDTQWRGTVEPFLSSIDTVDGRLQAGQVPEPPAVPSGERA